MENTLARVVGRELDAELTAALERINHCLGQLSEEQLWQRSAEDRNSIGNLLLHLTGNVRQWIVSGLGGAADVRDRPSEFSERRVIPKAELQKQLEATVNQARAVLTGMTEADWLQQRRIQGFEETGVGAAISSVAHFRGHTQEIIHITRDLLGDRYRFAWVPATPEQGAPGTAP
jgi:hypothetical protein